MADSVLKKDSEMQFPLVTVLKASAGSGKTRTLTERFVQFLLSEKIPRSGLRNVLAVTFSNNAAKEMKERVLSWLKAVHFGREAEVGELSGIISLPPEELVRKSGLLIDHILDNYADFQVKTIDSFMTSVFKASAIDFGYNPDFDILMNSDLLMAYSFNLFLREVREGTDRAALIGEIVDILLEHKKSDTAYIWDPSSLLLQEIQKIYRKLASTGKGLTREDHAERQKEIQERITDTLEAIEKEISASGLEPRANSSYATVLSLVRKGNFPDLIGKGYVNPPVKKCGRGRGQQAAYDRVISLWNEAVELVSRYAVLYASSSCAPYVHAYDAFSMTLHRAKRQQGKVFIEDVNLHLSEYLGSDVVPDVYFRLGETIFHYFIDEFQDTSPIQWRNLFPLVENSLAQGGSLFAVGDTKQAIYGFRNADYTIMKGLEKENPFRAAQHEVKELDRNFRSRARIIEFSEKVFKERVAGNELYRDAGERSGLTGYIQKQGRETGDAGYAEVLLLERHDDNPEERLKLQSLIEELCSRRYRRGDIAVLTQKNEDAVRVTTWLNERDIPFISYSSLDVRRRKVTGELVALLNFLESPTDDFSFGVFLLGDIFGMTLAREFPETGIGRIREFLFSQRAKPPLYKAFQKEFGSLWERCFEGLFRETGYLPLYDLVTEVFAVFRVFDCLPGEEATLAKILEVVKEFEGMGFNSLKDFLLSASGDGDDGTAWDMAVPKNTDAVQVMTVHKAKGLGFPVVILLLYEVRNRGFEYIVKEEERTITLLKINRAIAACDEDLQALYAQEQAKELVNRLNSLYVGFTRPERELYVIGVRSSDKGFPFPLLPSDEFPPSAGKPAYAKEVTTAFPAPPPCLLLHRYRTLEFPAKPATFISVEEKKRGEFIHRVFALIGYAEDDFEAELECLIQQVTDETGTAYPAGEIKGLVLSVVRGRGTASCFTRRAGREVRREQEYSDGSGRLFRMDRVVIDSEAVTVIDFKTGKNREGTDRYREQMAGYLGIMREIYPERKVTGIISFVDLGGVEEMA